MLLFYILLGLFTLFIGSVGRLLIHLLIKENAIN